MLISELIVRHLPSGGDLHERGIRLDQTQLPPGVRVHHDGAEDGKGGGARNGTEDGTEGGAADGNGAATPAAGDLLLVSAPVGAGLRERVDPSLPVGATVALLFGVEVAELPVGRVLAALAVAGLQVVEAAVVSGTPEATVAVVATRTDEPVPPQPRLAHDLEPGDHSGPAVLRRVLGEHALEALVQPARERVLMAQIAEHQARLGEQAILVKRLRADLLDYEATVRDLATARKAVEAGRKRMQGMAADLATARKEADLERKRMQSLRSSTSFKVASRMASVSSTARHIIRRSAKGPARG